MQTVLQNLYRIVVWYTCLESWIDTALEESGLELSLAIHMAHNYLPCGIVDATLPQISIIIEICDKVVFHRT